MRGLPAFRKPFPECPPTGPPSNNGWRGPAKSPPPVVHPVIRTHPVSGAKALFVSENFTTRILGLTEKESASILGFLFDHIARPEFTVRWQWKPDDLAIWDNRSTQHYAVNDYLPHRRVMHRATVLGDRPY